ncbi:MAG: hypothetical protein H6681_04825 [Desulfobacteraceae bacterium]|nr:hypothetical protein [Desulfobacteraceae bacterium]MCB9494747.1 hypothetical protein [Desulfobacteraceae bacterium]
MKKCIAVIGMHRSGTSAITKSLEVLGVSLGDNLLPPAEDNIKGFFEDREIVDFNDKILSAAGMTWLSCWEFPQILMEAGEGKELRHQAKKIVLKKTEETSLWGIKDPRLCILLFFWKEIFQELNIKTSYIFALRNPIDVCKSLEKRNNFDFFMGQILWLIYNFNAIRILKNTDICFAQYDNFLSNPDYYLDLFSRKFDLPSDSDKLEEFKKDFIDKNLRHSSSSSEDLNNNSEVIPFIKFFYEILCHAEKIQSMEPITKNWNNLEYEYLRTLGEAMNKMTWSRHSTINMFNDLERIYKDQLDINIELNNANLKVFEENKSLVKSNNMLNEEIDQLQTQITQLARDIENLNSQINTIYNSNSWKITKPVRNLNKFFSNIKKI